MKLCAFDVETTGTDEGFGLQPFRVRTKEAWLTSCAIATKAGVTAEVFNHPDPDTRHIHAVGYLARWLRSCAERKITICGWNIAFDMAWLIAMGLRDEVFACKWLDGMLLWRHIKSAPKELKIEPASFSLKAAVREYKPESAGYEEGVDFDDMSPEAVAKRVAYNKLDAMFTLDLTETFLSQLTTQQKRAALIEAACLPLMAETMVEGLRVDVEQAARLSEKLDTDAKVAMVTLKMTAGDIDEAVLSSPVKLRKLLFQEWGLPVQVLTDKGDPSTNRDALTQLAPLDSRANLLNTYREAKNNRTKFAEGVLKSADYNGDRCVRPSPRVYGTYTGRLTYSSSIGKGKGSKPTGIAIHQMKRDKEFRDMVVAPEGYTLIECDFAGQEFRWMAVMSNDRTMLEMCQPGEDAHAFMGAKIGGLSYEQIRRLLDEKDAKAKAFRQLGKVGNLSCQYRTSALTLQRVARVSYQLNLSLAEAQAIHANYRVSYPGVPKYWRRQAQLARHEGFVETIAGRRIYTGPGSDWVRMVASSTDPDVMAAQDWSWVCESTAINAPIQGSGADQKYLALMALRDYLPKVDGRVYFELHDGIYMVVPDRYAEKAVAETKQLLSTLPYKKAWGVDLPIEFPVDAKWGKTWGSMEEWKG